MFLGFVEVVASYGVVVIGMVWWWLVVVLWRLYILRGEKGERRKERERNLNKIRNIEY